MAGRSILPNVLGAIGLGILQFFLYFGAIDAWTTGEFRISESRDDGPPTKIYVFRGADAMRIGAGIGAIAMTVSVWTFNLLFRPRGGTRLTLIWSCILLLALAAILMFPPWQAPSNRAVAVFYGFLAIASVGWVLLHRSRGRRLPSLVLGVAGAGLVAIAFGGEMAWIGIFAAALTFGAVAAHLVFAHPSLVPQFIRKKASDTAHTPPSPGPPSE
jgi:hypothetical protein